MLVLSGRSGGTCTVVLNIVHVAHVSSYSLGFPCLFTSSSIPQTSHISIAAFLDWEEVMAYIRIWLLNEVRKCIYSRWKETEIAPLILSEIMYKFMS